jgi:hypothetical protein
MSWSEAHVLSLGSDCVHESDRPREIVNDFVVGVLVAKGRFLETILIVERLRCLEDGLRGLLLVRRTRIPRVSFMR